MSESAMLIRVYGTKPPYLLAVFKLQKGKFNVVFTDTVQTIKDINNPFRGYLGQFNSSNASVLKKQL